MKIVNFKTLSILIIFSILLSFALEINTRNTKNKTSKHDKKHRKGNSSSSGKKAVKKVPLITCCYNPIFKEFDLKAQSEQECKTNDKVFQWISFPIDTCENLMIALKATEVKKQ